MTLTGGNRHDVTQLIPLLDAIKPIAGKVGRPRTKPDIVLADRGYDFTKHRRLLWARGIKPVIAKRGVAHGSGLGRDWVVERAFAHLHNFRRLRTRYRQRPSWPASCGACPPFRVGLPARRVLGRELVEAAAGAAGLVEQRR